MRLKTRLYGNSVMRSECISIVSVWILCLRDRLSVCLVVTPVLTKMVKNAFHATLLSLVQPWGESRDLQ